MVFRSIIASFMIRATVLIPNANNATGYVNNCTGIALQKDNNESGRMPGFGIDTYGSSTGMAIEENYVRVEGLQLETVSPTAAGRSDIRLGYHLLKGHASATLWQAGIASDNDSTYSILRAYNNILFGFDDSLTSNSGMDFGDANGLAYVYNNTIVEAYRPFRQSDGTVIVKNNIAQECGNNCFDGTFDGTSQYNISSDGTAPGPFSKTSATVSFVNSLGSNYHLSGYDSTAREAGTALSADAYLSFTDDSDGDTRPSNTYWDIGADEFTTGQGGDAFFFGMNF